MSIVIECIFSSSLIMNLFKAFLTWLSSANDEEISRQLKTNKKNIFILISTCRVAPWIVTVPRLIVQRIHIFSQQLPIVRIFQGINIESINLTISKSIKCFDRNQSINAINSKIFQISCEQIFVTKIALQKTHNIILY